VHPLLYLETSFPSGTHPLSSRAHSLPFEAYVFLLRDNVLLLAVSAFHYFFTQNEKFYAKLC
jgi:hypothetical protein